MFVKNDMPKKYLFHIKFSEKFGKTTYAQRKRID